MDVAGHHPRPAPRPRAGSRGVHDAGRGPRHRLPVPQAGPSRERPQAAEVRRHRPHLRRGGRASHRSAPSRLETHRPLRGELAVVAAALRLSRPRVHSRRSDHQRRPGAGAPAHLAQQARDRPQAQDPPRSRDALEHRRGPPRRRPCRPERSPRRCPAIPPRPSTSPACPTPRSLRRSPRSTHHPERGGPPSRA